MYAEHVTMLGALHVNEFEELEEVVVGGPDDEDELPEAA